MAWEALELEIAAEFAAFSRRPYELEEALEIRSARRLAANREYGQNHRWKNQHNPEYHRRRRESAAQQKRKGRRHMKRSKPSETYISRAMAMLQEAQRPVPIGDIISRLKCGRSTIAKTLDNKVVAGELARPAPGVYALLQYANIPIDIPPRKKPGPAPSRPTETAAQPDAPVQIEPVEVAPAAPGLIRITLDLTPEQVGKVLSLLAGIRVNISMA